MSLNTQLLRNGEPLPIPGGWAWWHLDCISKAAKQETSDEKASFMQDRLFTERHVFTAHESEIWARGWEDTMYTFTILPGDHYVCWR